MILIINTINLKTGGALQRSISFLNELKFIKNNEYHIFYSNSVKEQIDIFNFESNFKFYFFHASPASITTRKPLINQLNTLEEKINPDVVFSFVGPAYWKPKSPHLVGFGIPHIVYSEYDYVRKYSYKVKLEMIYKKLWTKYEANYFVVQTEDVKYRLSKALSIKEEKIFVVSNGPGEQYKNTLIYNKNSSNTKKLLLISRYRPSKNFEIINDIIKILRKRKIKIEFHVTIEPTYFNKIFKSNDDFVINHGSIYAKDCPELYNQCDAMFLPSHLECFSASYAEAMKMKKPILTSNLSFAHTVCKDAALYFNNRDAVDIAEKIELLFNDESLYAFLVKKGEIRLKDFDDSQTQAKKYITICEKIKADNSE